MNETEDKEQFEQLKAWLAQRNEDRKVINRIDDKFLRADRKSKRVLLGLLSISFLWMLCALFTCAHAAIKSSKEDAPSIVLKRGSTTVESGFADLDACQVRKVALRIQDGATRVTGSAVYDCIHTMRSRIAFGPNPPPSNRAPTIAGEPAKTVQPAQSYSFAPMSVDPDSDTLAYSIANKPSWAGFDTATGRLSGTPADADVGAYANVVISVSDGRLSASLAPFSISVLPAPNRAPTISGTPAATGVVGVPYSFTPTAADPDGDVLTFIVDNRPPWATFDTATGKLSGTPGPTHVGVRSELRIRVQDGRGGEAVLAFGKLTILPAPTTSATLSWTPPAKNTDDTALTNLAGYRIVYGTEPSALTRMVEIPNPVTTSYIVDQLTPATWYFAVRAYNATGAESVNSNIASKTLP